MNLPKAIAGKVARGEATMAVLPGRLKAPKVAHRYCVKRVKEHKADKPDIQCYIIPIRVEQAFAGDVDYSIARACGYKTTDAFRATWVRWRDAKWIDAQEVTEDAGITDVDRWMTDADLLPRFDSHHAHQIVHVVEFKPAVDTPRFLAAPGMGEVDQFGNADYTRQRHRAVDELEVVDAAWQKRYADLARKQRESFKRDLEIGRQKQRNERRDNLFKRAA